jgi:amidase
MVPVAHANDGGGSIRIPAACCGLVGLKPQRNRISLDPEVGQSFLGVDGALTHTVADTAAVLDALAGAAVGDAAWAPPPPEPFAAAASRRPGRLRVAVTVTPPIDAPVEEPCARAAREVGALLESLGHVVEEVDPPWRRPMIEESFTALFAPLVMLHVVQGRLINGREPEERDVEPLSWALWKLVQRMSALDHATAAARLELFARGLLGWMDAYDVIVAPALAEAPVLLETVDWRTDDPMGLFARSAAFTPFTAVANVTGQPAISLPLRRHGGLPVGVQLFGRPAQEGALLAVAAQLEEADPWEGNRPALGRAGAERGGRRAEPRF